MCSGGASRCLGQRRPSFKQVCGFEQVCGFKQVCGCVKVEPRQRGVESGEALSKQAAELLRGGAGDLYRFGIAVPEARHQIRDVDAHCGGFGRIRRGLRFMLGLRGLRGLRRSLNARGDAVQLGFGGTRAGAT